MKEMINQPNLSDWLTIYTDGACKPNPGKGGWAYCVIRNNVILASNYGDGRHKTSKGELEVLNTSNQMELKAIYESLQDELVINSHIGIFSDSKWSINCITRRWTANTNLQLLWQIWNLLAVRIHKGLKTNFTHVKGHRGNIFNEYVDMLATKGRKN